MSAKGKGNPEVLLEREQRAKKKRDLCDRREAIELKLSNYNTARVKAREEALKLVAERDELDAELSALNG